MPRFVRLHGCPFIVIAALLLALAGPVRAQSSMAMSIFNDQSTFSPELSRADLDVFKRVLSLKPEETSAMEDLYAAYSTSLKDEGRAVRAFVAEVMEESEAMVDQRLLARAHDKLGEWGKRSEELKKTFMADLKSLLTRDQESRWPIVERELRRIKLLGWGRVPGEQPDLVKLVEDLPAEARRAERLTDLLERYSQEIDRAIQSRAAYLEKHRTDYPQAVKDSPEEARRIFVGATRERETLANVNERYLREICGEIRPAHVQELKDRYFKLCYPILSKGTRGERFLAAVPKLDSLTTEQRSQIMPVLSEYDRERRVLVQKIADHLREERLTRLPEDLEIALGIPSSSTDRDFSHGFPPDHPQAKLRNERYQLDKSYRTRVSALLTPEQIGQLPDLAGEHVTFYEDVPYGL